MNTKSLHVALPQSGIFEKLGELGHTWIRNSRDFLEHKDYPSCVTTANLLDLDKRIHIYCWEFEGLESKPIIGYTISFTNQTDDKPKGRRKIIITIPNDDTIEFYI